MLSFLSNLNKKLSSIIRITTFLIILTLFSFGNAFGVDYTITATAGPNGTIDPTGAVVVNEGGSQTFTITPDTGFHVLDVVVDDVLSVGALTEYTFTSVDADHTIEATFEINSYTLTINIMGAGSGTVDESVGGYPSECPYDYGTEVTLNAVADIGSVFAGWSGHLTGSENPEVILMDDDKTVTATFDVAQFTISGTVLNDLGSPLENVVINGLPGPPSSDYEGNYNALVDYDFSGTATPQLAGYSFTPPTRDYNNVTSDHTGENYTGSPVTPTISGTVRDSGASPLSGVTIAFSSGGGTAVTEVDGTYSHQVSYGWSGTATPSLGGYTFDPLNIDYSGGVTSDLVNQDYTGTLNSYTLTTQVSPAGVGNVTRDPDYPSYTHGTSVELTAMANAGYAFSHWSNDASGSDNPLTVVMDSAKTVTANFIQNYTLTITTTGTGTGTVTSNDGGINCGTNCSVDYAEGTDVILSALAEPDSVFSGWSGDVPEGHENDSPLTVTMDQNRNITATFDPAEVTISGTVTDDESAPIEGVQINGLPGNPTTNASGFYSATVSHGFSGTATPQMTGYSFTPSSRNYDNIVSNQENQDYTGILDTYTITASAGANGSITPSGDVTVDHGDDQAFTITPDTGFHVLDVLVDGESVGAVTSYNFTNVTANHTITTSFERNEFVTNIENVTVPEGETEIFQVKLNFSPSSNIVASVDHISGDTDISVQSGSNLTFTSENWDTYQTVTLKAADDVDLENGTATIGIRAANIANKDITATEQDGDSLNFVTDKDAVDVTEGGTGQFQVKLNAQPSSDVTVNIIRASGDEDITVTAGGTLIFTHDNWDAFQTVTLSAAQDVDIVNGKATIRISATGVPNKDVIATEMDNDSLNFVIDTDPVGVPEGGTATFGVKLSAQPTSAVNATVVRTSGDTDISVTGGGSLTFNTDNWDTFQTVTLSAAQDVDIADGTATIRISADGVPNRDVTANEQDDDTLSFITNTGAVNVPEGSTASFQVKLNAQPSSDVSVGVARVSGDNSITVSSGSSLTFNSSNWNTFQTVTLSASEDADTANGTATIRISASGISDKDITATEQDDDILNGNISLILNPAIGTSGNNIEISVDISNNNNSISAYGFDFVFDEAFFQFNGVEVGTLTSDWIINVYDIYSGRKKIEGIGGTSITSSSSGSLVKIQLQVLCLGYTTDTQSQVLIENYTDNLYDEFSPEPAAEDFNFTPCGRLGDVNNSGSVTPGDAQSAFEIFLGIITPDFCQESSSDANCNEYTTPGDAQDIFEHFLGIGTLPQCCAEYTASSMLRFNEPIEPIGDRNRDRERENDRFVLLERKLYPLHTMGYPGEIVRIPIIVFNPEGITSFAFEMNYPSELIEFLGMDRTRLTQHFEYIAGVEMSDGLIRVEGESEVPVKIRNIGSLAVLIFRVIEGPEASMPLLIFNLEGDLLNADTAEGNFHRLKLFSDEPRYINLGKAIHMHDGTVRVPVRVSTAFNVKSFGFKLEYAADKMTFIGVEKGSLTEDFVEVRGNEIEFGRVMIGAYSLSRIQEKRQDTLLELVFSIEEEGGEINVIKIFDDIENYIIQRGKIRVR